MIPYAHLSPTLTWISLVIGAVGLVTMVIVAFTLRRRALRSAEQSPSLSGDEVLLTGTVEFSERETVAMRVEISERGEQRKTKNRYTTHWHETARTTTFKPFYVKLKIGHRVRIEPSDDTVFADALDHVDVYQYGYRRRSATLEQGEQVWVHGALVDGLDPEVPPAGYRDGGGVGRVVRTSSRAPLTVATQPLEKEFHDFARGHRKFGVAWVALTLLFIALCVAPTVSIALGTHETCEVTSVTLTKNSKGRFAGFETVCHTQTRELTELLPDPVKIGTLVPARIGVLATQIGEDASVSSPASFICLLFALLAAIFYGQHMKKLVPWYRQSELKTVDPGEMPRPLSK